MTNMKKLITLLLISILSVTYANAQISEVVEKGERYETLKTFKESLLFTALELRKLNVEKKDFYLCFPSSNDFDDGCAVFYIGTDKKTAIETLKTLKACFEQKKESVTDVYNNKIVISKMAVYYYVDQKGVAESSRTGHSSNAIKLKFFDACIKTIENYKD